MVNRRAFLLGSVGAALALRTRGLAALPLPSPSGRSTPELAGTELAGEDGLYALILGSAQDGGMPQAGCYAPRCDAARADPRLVTSVALVDPEADRYYLVDASPDLRAQMDLIPEPGFRRRADARRPFDGIFLTHAHIGHYLGLALLGRESLGIQPTPCYCSPQMQRMLSENAPWSLLVDEGRITFPPVSFDEWIDVDGSFEVKLLPVPHRPEFSDTVGFIFRGPRASLLYLPDIDSWEEWDRSIAEVAAGVDFALLDATFYSANEIPGRKVEDIPHPLVPHTMDLLQETADQGTRVILTHMNNTNPMLADDSAEAESVRQRGFEIARAGMKLEL